MAFYNSARLVRCSPFAPLERLMRYSPGVPSLFVEHWKLIILPKIIF